MAGHGPGWSSDGLNYQTQSSSNLGNTPYYDTNSQIYPHPPSAPPPFPSYNQVPHMNYDYSYAPYPQIQSYGVSSSNYAPTSPLAYTTPLSDQTQNHSPYNSQPFPPAFQPHHLTNQQNSFYYPPSSSWQSNIDPRGQGETGKGKGKGHKKGKGKGGKGNQFGQSIQMSSSINPGLNNLDDGNCPSVLYCEPCDREFTTKTAQDAHLKSHVKCSHPDCLFSGSQKVVNTHYELSHGQFSGTGYRMIDVQVGDNMVPFRVLMGTSPEEVRQWREERRNKWPTKESIEKKEALKRARSLNGQLNPEPKLNVRGKVMKDNNNRQESGTESGGLSELLAAYGSDSDSEKVEDVDGKNDGVQNSNNSSGIVVKKGKNCEFWLHQGKCNKGDECIYKHNPNPEVCSFFVSGKCSKGRKCIFAHNPILVKEERLKRKAEKHKDSNDDDDHDNDNGIMKTNLKKKKKVNETDKKNKASFQAKPSEPTLLRKLLETEMRREKSMYLQAIRYIIDHDFFDAESQPNEVDGPVLVEN